MVGSGQNAADFIEKITAAAQAGSKRDYDELLAYSRHEDPKAESVNIYAAISLDLYSRDPQGLDTDKLVAQLQQRYTPFK